MKLIHFVEINYKLTQYCMVSWYYLVSWYFSWYSIVRHFYGIVTTLVWGCISAYCMGSLHVLEGTMNAEWYIKVLEQHMLPSRRRVFQQDNAKPHTAAITTAWLRSRRVRVLNWPACSPDLSPIENIWPIIKQKIRQRRPRTLQQLEAYIRQEWDQIPTPKLITLTHNLDAQTSSNCFEKKRRCYTMVNMPPSQLFWDL